MISRPEIRTDPSRVAVFRDGTRCDLRDVPLAPRAADLLALALHRTRDDPAEPRPERLVLTIRREGAPRWTVTASWFGQSPGGLAGWDSLPGDIADAIDRLCRTHPGQETLCLHLHATPLTAHDAMRLEILLRDP